MKLPPELLSALLAPEGGRITLVVGAGCSFEPRTSLPLARQCAVNAHKSLVEDGVLAAGDCTAPEDLSSVADAVFEKTGSQRALVERMPIGPFQSADPNDGYLLAAALLRERILNALLTLNFDLAARNALNEVGPADHVVVIRGPQDYGRIGGTNIIYLHRDALAEPDEWILRTAQLEEAWRASWEEFVTTRVAVVPVVVFIGLGSRVAVLTETIKRIRSKIGSAVVIEVDVAAQGDSEFAAELAVPPERYIQAGWCDFMRALAHRVTKRQVEQLQSAADVLCERERITKEDLSVLVARLISLGLLALGRIRSAWLLRGARYQPMESLAVELISEIIVGIAMAERIAGATAELRGDGLVDLMRGNQLLGRLRPCSGVATMKAESLIARVRYAHRDEQRPLIAIGFHVAPGIETVAPDDLVAGGDEGSVVSGPPMITFVVAAEMRQDPTAFKEMLTH